MAPTHLPRSVAQTRSNGILESVATVVATIAVMLIAFAAAAVVYAAVGPPVIALAAAYFAGLATLVAVPVGGRLLRRWAADAARRRTRTRAERERERTDDSRRRCHDGVETDADSTPH